VCVCVVYVDVGMDVYGVWLCQIYMCVFVGSSDV